MAAGLHSAPRAHRSALTLPPSRGKDGSPPREEGGSAQPRPSSAGRHVPDAGGSPANASPALALRAGAGLERRVERTLGQAQPSAGESSDLCVCHGHTACRGEGGCPEPPADHQRPRPPPLPATQVTNLGPREGGDWLRSPRRPAANQTDKPPSAGTLRGGSDKVTSVAGHLWLCLFLTSSKNSSKRGDWPVQGLLGGRVVGPGQRPQEGLSAGTSPTREVLPGPGLGGPSSPRAHLWGQGWELQVSTAAGCGASALHRERGAVLSRPPQASTQRTSRSRRPPPHEALQGPKSPAAQLRRGTGHRADPSVTRQTTSPAGAGPRVLSGT